MYRLGNTAVFAMSAENAAVLEVEDKSTVVFETMDCFSNQLTSEEQKIETLDWSCINPATGPVYVRGAQPGDALKISILDIKVAQYGTMVALPQNGVLGEYVQEGQIKRIEVKGGIAYFNSKIHLPCVPMIGVIGVAPERGAISCGEPGSHGGNMDTTKIAAGSVLYLPVFQPGALLAMGDVHACMGDGEIMVSGLEIPAEITVHIEVIKNAGIKNPMLESPHACYTIASHEDVEQAVKVATLDMANLLMRKNQLSFNEAGMLLSAAGNLQFCQMVDPKRTVRMEVPKTILSSLF
jgi:amidase